MQHGLNGLKIAIMVANGFEERHFTEAQRALVDTGAVVTVISPENGLANSWHGKNWGHYFPTDKQLGEVLAADFDALIVPGGSRSILKLSGNAHARRIVCSFVDGAKPIVALGEAIGLLAGFDRVAGMQVTGCDSEKAAVEEKNGLWTQQDQDEAVICGTFFTAAGTETETANLVAQGLSHIAETIESYTQQAA